MEANEVNMYKHLKKQPNKLGSFENLDQWGGGGEVSSAISAIGNAVTGVVSALGQTKVLTTQARETRKIAIVNAIEGTKKLSIATQGSTQQASIDVERVRATYGSITQLVMGAGIVIAIIVVSGAFAYKTAVR